MKAVHSMQAGRRLVLFLFLPGLLLLTSCARKVVFQTSPVVPAATGTVKMKRDNNKNYTLDIRVRNLSEPERLTPSKRYYVAWLETERNGVKNLGRLVSSSGLFSKKLKASLKVVTPFEPRRVFITAEDDVSIQYPGIQVVLRSGSF